jgi:S-formylglutathione hydrolase FrmB
MNKSRRLLLRCVVLTLLALGFAAAPAHAAPRAECRTVPSKILDRHVQYCVLLPPSYDADKSRRYPVLYFLHGLGEDEQVLLDSGGWDLIQDLWNQVDIGEFLIVSPNGDRSFFINSLDGKRRYEDFFVDELLPFIDSHYRTKEGRHNRGIAGVSMGGYGALHLALRHTDLFSAVSANSAALIENPPQGKVDSDAAQIIARALGNAFGSPFNRAFWDRNSPFTLVREGAPAESLQIYFDCGTEDDFGFNRGAQQFHDLLASRHIPHEFHLYPGGHDLNYFADHLPASLEFQSKALDAPPVAK